MLKGAELSRERPSSDQKEKGYALAEPGQRFVRASAHGEGRRETGWHGFGWRSSYWLESTSICSVFGFTGGRAKSPVGRYRGDGSRNLNFRRRHWAGSPILD